MEDVTEGCFPGWLHFFLLRSRLPKLLGRSTPLSTPFSKRELQQRCYLLALLLSPLKEQLSFGLCDLLSVFLQQNCMADCLFSPVLPKGKETLGMPKE